MKLDVESLLAEAARLRQTGNLAGAELLYRQILAHEPHHADSLHALGLLRYLQGDLEAAIELISRAIAVEPGIADYHSNLGLLLAARGRRDEAVASFQLALQLEPDLAEGWNNLGNVLANQNRVEAAAQAYEKALVLQPRAAAIHVNLASVLRRAGRLDAAVSSYRKAWALDSGDVETLHRLGDTLRQQGRLEEAEAEYRRSLTLRPRDTEALNALCVLALARGDTEAALAAIRHSRVIQDSPRARRLLAELMQQMGADGIDSELRPLLARAIAEAWDWPGKLAKLAADVLRPAIVNGAAMEDDLLLHTLLISCPNCDLELENFLAVARRRLLENLPEPRNLDFTAALARQCFINEYLFDVDAAEVARAEAQRQALCDALAADAAPAAGLVAVVAAYFPLGEIPHADGLLKGTWPEALEAVLTQQLREPAEEARLRGLLPALTPVADAVSLRVRDQYEEHPYPRWVLIAPGDTGPAQTGNDLDILVAGCGTGQYLVSLAQQSAGARILAVDLSLASLAYAQRKALEAGLTDVAFAQADILEMRGLERSFDLIECGGVLHMLDDPLAGWRALLGLLRPGGTMRLALYSELGRRNIAAAKDFVGCPQVRVSAEEIRRARRKLIAADNDAFRDVTDSSDFFSLSGCRNLLFLAQERRLNLEVIAAFLQAEHLSFLGFSTEDRVLAQYRRRFPDNPDFADLAQWQVFERENPDIFLNMYQFWVRKEE